jgi:hypothetical protein
MRKWKGIERETRERNNIKGRERNRDKSERERKSKEREGKK